MNLMINVWILLNSDEIYTYISDDLPLKLN